MRKLFVLCGFVLSLLLSGCSTTKILYPKVMPEIQSIYHSSVFILSDEGKVNGSGTIIENHDRHLAILTAAHVVRKQNEGTKYVGVLIGKKKGIGYIYKYNDKFDLALVIVTRDKSFNGPYIKVSDSVGKIGQRVWVIGAPMGEKRTVTIGIISNRVIYEKKLLYRTNAELFFGNSGGGMFNQDGELIGVTHALNMVRLNPFCSVVEPGGSYVISLENIKTFLK